MSRQTLYILIGAAIIIAAILIFMRRPRVAGSSVFENIFYKANSNTETNYKPLANADGGYSIDPSWLWAPNDEGVDQVIKTYTTE